MPEIEIGINRKGEPAVLKIIDETGWCESELDGIYKSIGIVHISPGYELTPGKKKKSYLLEILSKEESNIKKIKEKLQ